MSRITVLVSLSLWIGSALLLSQLRWFGRSSLSDRLRAYGHGVAAGVRPTNVERAVSLRSVRDVLAPLASDGGARLAALFGVREELRVRLHRLHLDDDVTAFRLRQCGWSAGTGVVALLGVLALPVPAVAALFVTFAAPLLAFLVVEQRLAAASARRQQQLLAELPVVAEQLGMLLGAGFSLGGAVSRIARRGNGAASEDLARVANRIRQGLSDADALAEWARISGLDEVERLVTVLSLHRHGADLGRLVGAEARALRRAEQRRNVELVERRNQLVWVPVTLATLVPGVLFMAVPFISALQAFAEL